MIMPMRALIFVVFTVGGSFAQAANAAEERSKDMVEIEAIIKRIEASPSPTLRTKYAMELAELVEHVNVADIDVEAIDGVTALLSIEDDSVRYWAASSLGHMGARASRAVSALERALKEQECIAGWRGGLTSEPALRLALEKIGSKPVRQDCGR
jgi:hypothetical protein